MAGSARCVSGAQCYEQYGLTNAIRGVYEGEEDPFTSSQGVTAVSRNVG